MNITVEQLHQINNPYIIDIRNSNSYNMGHIPNAINIPYEELLINHNNYLNKYETYYIYCSVGSKSNVLALYLEKMGYQIRSIIGGYQSYKLCNNLR